MASTAGGNRDYYRQVVVQTLVDALRTSLIVDGEAATLTSATVSIYLTGGSIIVTDADCTLEDTDTVAAYSQEWAEATYERAEGLKAVWSIVASGVTYQRVDYFSVVRRRFRSELRDSTITSRYPYFGALSTTTFKPWRDEAWQKIEQYLWDRIGKYPGNLFNPNKFHDAHLFLTCAAFHWYNALSGNAIDLDVFKAEKFDEMGMSALGSASSSVDFDDDDDGILDEDEKNRNFSTLRGER